jgi:hypothetical protein
MCRVRRIAKVSGSLVFNLCWFVATGESSILFGLWISNAACLAGEGLP